jgi:hypothetical protein
MRPDYLKVEPLSEVLEASSAHPVIAVRSHPSFKLSLGVILEDVIREVDPAELALIVVPVRPVGGPGPPRKCGVLEV